MAHSHYHHHLRTAYGRLRALRPWQGVRILGYHRISTDPGSLCVHPHAFRRQLEKITRTEATVIGLPRAIELLNAGPVGGRYVCVTFDDGYREFQDEAYSALKEFDFPATLFVPTAIIDGTSSFYWYANPPEGLSWDELRELRRGGLVDVQSHTRTHPWLPHLSEAAARAEIAGSRSDLASRLGGEVTTLSYPAGLHGAREVTLAADAGYSAAVTTDAGVNDGSESRFRLRRTMVFREDSDRMFALKLAGVFDRQSLPYRVRQWQRRRQAAPGYPETDDQ